MRLFFQKYGWPVLWVLVFQVVGGLIGSVTAGEIDGWYRGLEKAAYNPPDIVFPIVWPILYVMIALAGWLSWGHRQSERGPVIWWLFVLYTLLNWGWSFVFFAAHEVFLGFMWIIVLNLVALVLILMSWISHRKIAFLMITPFLWTCFAAYLNYSIWILNL